MDQKTWLWRKRSAEKTIVTNGEDAQTAQPDREAELENSLKSLNEKLASAIDECTAKDEQLQSYKTSSEDANAEKLKAEEEIQRLNKELDEAVTKYSTANNQLIQLNSALKDSMEQLNLLRSEQEQTIQEAITKANRDLERSCKKLEEDLSENNKGLATLTVENSYLTKALTVKEKLIEGLKEKISRNEAEFGALMTRLDSVEKENAFLRYEFRALEKELDLRSEEVEGYRRNLEAAKKQRVENGKKFKKLEAECARLRDLNRKRFPGSDAFSHVKREYESNQINTLRRKGSKGDSLSLHSRASSDLERENACLRESLVKREEEISLLRIFVEKLDLDKLAISVRDESSSCSNDVMSYGIEASEMSLMDDFLKMEKLAIVSVDDPQIQTTKDLVPFEFEQESKQSWLEDVRNLILKQHEVSKASFDELLEDIKKDLHNVMNPPEPLINSLPISGYIYIAWKSPASSPRSGLIENPTDELISSESLIKSSVLKIVDLVDKLEKSPEETERKIRAFAWKSSELSTKLRELVSACKNLSDGRIKFEKFIEDQTLILAWIIEHSTSYEDDGHMVRDLFTKNLGEKSGPGTALGLESVQKLMLEMEKIHSMSQVEIKSLKNELSSMVQSSGKDTNREESKHESELSQEKIETMLEELRRTYEDQIEDLKMTNADIDTQLTVTKSELHEAVRKLSSVEAELDNKSHCCEELKGTCVDLQLQLESISSNQNVESNGNEGDQEDLLQTGMKIAKASEKLAECEEAIFKLGNHLKSITLAKELPVVDKVLNFTEINGNNKKQLNLRPSLRDHMLSEDHNYNVAEPNKYSGSRALVVVGKKQSAGGFGFLKKMIFRRKKNTFKKSSLW